MAHHNMAPQRHGSNSRAAPQSSKPACLRLFELDDLRPTLEHGYYTPWTYILQHLFPFPTYVVRPTPALIGGYPDIVVCVLVGNTAVPVLVVEIKPPQSMRVVDGRGRADRQMRCRLLELSRAYKRPPANIGAPLYGIVAFGTQFAVYDIEEGTRSICPPFTHFEYSFSNDVAPAIWWGYNIKGPRGAAKLQEIARTIHQQQARRPPAPAITSGPTSISAPLRAPSPVTEFAVNVVARTDDHLTWCNLAFYGPPDRPASDSEASGVSSYKTPSMPSVQGPHRDNSFETPTSTFDGE